jgi:hypothetical protein
MPELIMVTRCANETRQQYRSRAYQFLDDTRSNNIITDEVSVALGILLTGPNVRAYVNMQDAK